MNQWKKQGVLVLVICMLLSVPYPGWLSSVGTVHAAVSFVGGDGSEDEPFQITTAEQLNEIRNHPTSHFVLINDIDLSTDASTIAWEPIINFSGSLDGRGNTISNLIIDKSSNNVGLFANVLTEGRIENLVIVAVEVRGLDYVGILVGSHMGLINNVSVSGAVYGDNYVGGLIGDSDKSNISNSIAAGSVLGEGDYVGGLIGHALESIVSHNSASGLVVSKGGYVGGLVGESRDSEISDSFAVGDVKANLRYIGGLIGRNRGGDVTNSYAKGAVVGDFGPVAGNFGYVGGLIGRNSDGDEVKDSFATGNVTANSDYIGGLIGYAVGSVANSYATGHVNGEQYVGGLIGDFRNGDISNSFAEGTVTGGNYVGGLAGLIMEGNTSNSSASGDVQGDKNVGGLVGEYKTGTMTESYAMGSVTANRNEGGLVGSFQNGDVSLSYATGEVSGLKNTGGLIGELVKSHVISSYSTGNVTGSVDAGGLIGGNRDGDLSFSFATGTVAGCDDIGGLVGDTDDGKVSNSYATGNVTGICNPGSNSIGGLVGDNRSGTIENSFAIGSIIGNISDVGGLVGDGSSGIITNSYYDMDLSGQSDNKGQGLTSEQMKNIANYDGWYFDTIWNMDQHHYGYPYLAGMQAFLTYMGNDSNDGSGMYVSKSYRIGSSVTIEDFNWTRTGHLFQGWNTESDGSGMPYEIGDERPLNSNLLLYATWKRVSSGSGSWQSDNANLANLIVTIGGGELALSPQFSAEKTSYQAETMSSEAIIKATPSSAWATVTLEGERLNGEKTVVLAEGDNVFEIVVKAENGTLKTYSLTIHRVVDSEGTPTTPEAPGCTFSDVTGHWAKSFICEAFERGIVNGYTETRFSPQSGITRVEFAAILLRTLGMTSSASSLSGHGFVDQDQIPAWATSTVHIAVEKGLLQGYPDHSLRPLDNVSRAEMAAMIGRAMKWGNLLGNTTFHDDADIPHWAKGYIQEAVARGLLNGRGDNRFSPLESTTRAEAAVLLLRLWYVLKLNSESGN
ncbi:GLUG motif-containing protein [Paenibacillus sp. GXUN7292]|uniref:GLUG motif-containing protein n=1 Tax=Paenibacillus sp. GXUN7292 TaxID=3422499 RepID=UPI003D7EDBF5